MSAKPGEFQPVVVNGRMPQRRPLDGAARRAADAAAACMRRAAETEGDAETSEALRRIAGALRAPRAAVPHPELHATFEAGRARAEADMVDFLDAEIAHIERRNISGMVPRGDEVAEMRRAILSGRYRSAQ